MNKKLTFVVFVVLAALLTAIPAFANPPSNSGMNVVRYEGIVYLHNVDYSNGLSMVVGADIVEFCNTFSGFDLVSIQDIHVPEDANRVIQIAKGNDINTSVWPFTEFDCGLFTTIDPVATGTADFVSTDNDLFAYNNPENVNWNSFGFTAHGRLETPGGSEMKLNGVSRCVWDGVDLSSGGCSVHINLK